MDNRGSAREQPIVRRVADGETVVRKCLRIDAAPAGMEQCAPTGIASTSASSSRASSKPAMLPKPI